MRLGQVDLAGQAAGAAGAAGEIEHVVFVFMRGRQCVEPRLIDHDMAGGTGHLPFAGSLQRLSRILREFEQIVADFGLHRLRGLAIGADEMNLSCQHAFPTWLLLMRAAARSISSIVV